MDLRTLARALGGEVVGHQVLAPGPGHSPADRSMSVRLDAQAPNGFLAFSHAGDDWKACRDHVKRLLGMPEAGRQKVVQEFRHRTSQPDTVEAALNIWERSRTP